MAARKSFLNLPGFRVLFGWALGGAGGGASFDDNEFSHGVVLLQRILKELDNRTIVSFFLLARGRIEIHSSEL